MTMTAAQIQKIQARYHYLINYSSSNSDDPIDPMSYVDSNGDGLLHIAASAGDLETVEMLLHAGVDVDQPGDMGSTALHYARSAKRDAVAAMLVLFGARTDIKDDFGRVSGA